MQETEEDKSRFSRQLPRRMRLSLRMVLKPSIAGHPERESRLLEYLRLYCGVAAYFSNIFWLSFYISFRM